jgi:hypothetical protein
VAEPIGQRDPGRARLSSDAGQLDSPPPPDALSQLLEALTAEGLDRHALLACASELPDRLVTSPAH